MIVIQIILIVVLVAISNHFIGYRNNSRTKALKKLLLILSIPAAIYVVLFPDSSTNIANMLGVGRGADLLLYGLAIVMIFQLFNNYIKSGEENRRIVVLARKIAIIEALNDPHNKKHNK